MFWYYFYYFLSSHTTAGSVDTEVYTFTDSSNFTHNITGPTIHDFPNPDSNNSYDLNLNNIHGIGLYLVDWGFCKKANVADNWWFYWNYQKYKIHLYSTLFGNFN